jgi:TolC family type I secretion outer membrane protein
MQILSGTFGRFANGIEGNQHDAARLATARISVKPVNSWTTYSVTTAYSELMGTSARIFRGAYLALLSALSACATAPLIDGMPATSPSPNRPWKAPSGVIPAEPLVKPAATTVVPPEFAERIGRLTLADVVDLALLANPATRASWSQARAAADVLGSTKGGYFPVIEGLVSGSRSRSSASSTRVAGDRTEYGPSVTLNYLVFDFGGRAGSVERARANLIASDLTHNATLQNTVLLAESAYFNYVATTALLAAERAAIAEAQANLTAAERRNAVGLATIADVLQARTALSQEQLNRETIEGNLQAARGSLAVALGLPANVPFDIEPQPAAVPVRAIALTVDSVINEALRNRPDLAAARAQASAAAAAVRVARSAELPALNLSSNAARTYLPPSSSSSTSYDVTLGVSVPIFNGFSHQYDVRAARAQADAVSALADQTRQQVINQVFVSYYALQTAQQRVITADELLVSARQSAEVAAGRYREGVGSIIDLLTAQSALANARAQQVQSRWQWSAALAQLARDAGVLGTHGEMPFSFSSDSTAPNPSLNASRQ